MEYDKIVNECKLLNYREKLRIAQTLIQLAMKEEENKNQIKCNINKNYSIEYIIERLHKLHPSKKSTLLNSIHSMFQFQGGITEEVCEEIVKKLEHMNIIKITDNSHVTYL